MVGVSYRKNAYQSPATRRFKENVKLEAGKDTSTSGVRCAETDSPPPAAIHRGPEGNGQAYISQKLVPSGHHCILNLGHSGRNP